MLINAAKLEQTQNKIIVQYSKDISLRIKELTTISWP